MPLNFGEIIEMKENGIWTPEVENGKIFIESSDFSHDVRLYIDGDFKDIKQKMKYATELAVRLNFVNLIK